MAYISQIQDLSPAQSDRLSKVQFWLISELEDAGIEYGFSFYDYDQGWELAVAENLEDSTAYFRIDIKADRSTVDAVVSSLSNDLRDDTRCGHDFDCCGCVIFLSLRAAEMSKNHYVICERWGRNV